MAVEVLQHDRGLGFGGRRRSLDVLQGFVSGFRAFEDEPVRRAHRHVLEVRQAEREPDPLSRGVLGFHGERAHRGKVVSATFQRRAAGRAGEDARR